MPPVIEVEQLHKGYGEVVAVDDVSFSVDEGEIFGIIGPNGAGKTTTIECVIGLRTPDRGRISVLGMDPIRDRTALTERIGVQLQEAALADRIRVWEALDLFSSFYARTVPWQPLLQQWGLADHRSAMFGTLSGGQRQRLFIALALVNDPDVVILDELTSGLDPQARRATWDLVQAIREQGKTVLVITHFMDEAQFLCDRVAIVDHGSVIALDTPGRARPHVRHGEQSHVRRDRRRRLVSAAGTPPGRRGRAAGRPSERSEPHSKSDGLRDGLREHRRTAVGGGGMAGIESCSVQQPEHPAGRSGGCLSPADRPRDPGLIRQD